MATPPAPDSSSASAKSVDSSLWWDPFNQLLTELENVSPSSSSSELSPSLVKKLSDNHSWLLNTVSQFKPPSPQSREALQSQQIVIGSHRLTVLPELKEAALEISSALCLDEVQSYLLVKRSIGHSDAILDPVVLEPLHLVLLRYYIERQCLLKCSQLILLHALYVDVGSSEGLAIKEEAQRLIFDGLESRLLSVLEQHFSANYPEHMDLDLFTLWAEEILKEDILVLDILFLAYYESFCVCDGKRWKTLCLLFEGMISGSSNLGKLSISTEAVQYISHAKVQLLIILIETLDLENLLKMIHDDIPFRSRFEAYV